MLLSVQALKVLIRLQIGISSSASFAEYWKYMMPRRFLQQLTRTLCVGHIAARYSD